MNEIKDENFKNNSKTKYPQSMMDISRSYINKQDRINALNLYIQKSSYNPQFLQEEEEEDDESENETIGDIIFRIVSIIFPDFSPGLWFFIHLIMNLIVLCVGLSSLSEPNVHDPITEPKYNRSFIFGSIYCSFLILGVNIASFAMLMIFHAIVQKVILEKMLQPSALCAAFYNTVDPELVYLLWSSVQIIYWRSNLILKNGVDKSGDYYILRIFGYKDQDNPFKFLYSIHWLITFPILLYIVFAARLLFLSIISFVFELGFLMNAHDLLGRYLRKYGTLRKFNIEWFMFVADKQENIRALFGYELYQDEKLIRQLETNDISKKFVQDKAELLLFKNLPRNCTCCKIPLKRNKKNTMKLLLPPVFEEKNIIKSESSSIKNWLACHYVVNTPPLLFLLNNSIALTNKNSIKNGSEIFFRQIIMSLKIYHQDKNDTFVFTGTPMNNNSSDELSPNNNKLNFNLNKASNIITQEEELLYNNTTKQTNTEAKKINLENIFHDIDQDVKSEEKHLERNEEKYSINSKNKTKLKNKGKKVGNSSNTTLINKGKEKVLEKNINEIDNIEKKSTSSKSKEYNINNKSNDNENNNTLKGLQKEHNKNLPMNLDNKNEKTSAINDQEEKKIASRLNKFRKLKMKEVKNTIDNNKKDEKIEKVNDNATNYGSIYKNTLNDNKNKIIQKYYDTKNLTNENIHEKTLMEEKKENLNITDKTENTTLNYLDKKVFIEEKNTDSNEKTNMSINDSKFNIYITPSLSEIPNENSELKNNIMKNDNINDDNIGTNIKDEFRVNNKEIRNSYINLEKYNSMTVEIKDFSIEDVLKKKYTTDTIHQKETQDDKKSDPYMKTMSKFGSCDINEENKKDVIIFKKIDALGSPLGEKEILQQDILNNATNFLNGTNKETETRDISASFINSDKKKRNTNEMSKVSKKIKNKISSNKNAFFYQSHLLNEELNILERSDAINVKKVKDNRRIKVRNCLCIKKNKKEKLSRIKKDISLEIDDPFIMNLRSPLQLNINGNEFITKEMIEVFLKPEEAEEFMKEFDLSGHGRIDVLMFKNAIKRAITCRKKFIKSLKGQESILKLVRRLMSILMSFLASVVLLFIFGVSADTIIVTGAAFITAVTVILSYMYTSFITSVIFIAFSNPYNIGDRIRLDGGEAMYIKKIKTYTTEFETTTGKIVIYENSKLSNAKIYNESRSKNAYIDISFKVDINTPLVALKELRKSLQFLVDSRPSDFCKTKNLYFGYSLQPGHFYEISFWIKCVEGWGNWRKVFELRTDIYDFIILQLRLLSISYRLPTQKIGFTAPLNIADNSILKLNRNKGFEYPSTPKEARNPLFVPSVKHKREFDICNYEYNNNMSFLYNDSKNNTNNYINSINSPNMYNYKRTNNYYYNTSSICNHNNNNDKSIKEKSKDFCNNEKNYDNLLCKNNYYDDINSSIRYRSVKKEVINNLEIDSNKEILSNDFMKYTEYYKNKNNILSRNMDNFSGDSNKNRTVERRINYDYIDYTENSFRKNTNSCCRKNENIIDDQNNNCCDNLISKSKYLQCDDQEINLRQSMEKYDYTSHINTYFNNVNSYHDNYMYKDHKNSNENFFNYSNTYNQKYQDSLKLNYNDKEYFSYESSSSYDSFECVKHFSNLHNKSHEFLNKQKRNIFTYQNKKKYI
ncbi:mechanosensitive ion channel protein, putative [Plasmodium gallinaceum]|uniref:Mechanosensitive ion channel protein, putative n=1 Tax=Plasmodium gallinaceum TaxID=5849 RepID=A0A1J1GUD3_PLAGA|nr:mechanosensitive ion channel protein, putative [Plasmodium gallinaceum]CRG96137.1 mechanosensitive ion channel protein, putative [Plasmodium gallinaceum]